MASLDKTVCDDYFYLVALNKHQIYVAKSEMSIEQLEKRPASKRVRIRSK